MALGIGFLFGTQFLAVEFMRLCEDDTHSCNGKILTSFIVHVHSTCLLMFMYITTSSIFTNLSFPIIFPFISELDYIFGHFTGIFLVSTFWFAVYSLYMRNRPKIYPKVILPALASGIIWGIAMSELSCDYHVTF